MLPYLSYLLQLLNVGCFSLLKRAYSCEIEALMRYYINYITKLKFLPAFKVAFKQLFTLAKYLLSLLRRRPSPTPARRCSITARCIALYTYTRRSARGYLGGLYAKQHT
jgi:hypothetical protein